MPNYPFLSWLRARAKCAPLVLLIVPQFVTFLWGTFVPISAYVTLASARNVAAGRALSYGLEIANPTFPLRTPLYVLVLATLEKLGSVSGLRVPLLQASMVLSALGWGTTALALYRASRRMGRPIAAVACALLTALSPLVVSTSGTETAWVLALFWIAINLALEGRWQAQSVLLALMLWTHFSWTTLILALAMLAAQWFQERRFPMRSTLIVAIAAAAWGTVAIHLLGSAVQLSWPSVPAARHLQQLFAESELYWLSLPFVALALYTTRQKVVWAAVFGASLALIDSGPVAEAFAAITGLFLASLGIDSVVRWVKAGEQIRLEYFGGHAATVTASLALVASLPLVIAQADTMWHRYEARPIARNTVERQVGAWLSSHAEPATTVFGSGRVGYLAERTGILWEGRTDDLAGMSAVMDTLNLNLPDYCVSFNTINWDWLTRTNWFLDRYEPVKRFSTAYDAVSPLTIWRYRPSGFDRGQFNPVSASLPGGIQLTGCQYWPERVEPGDALYVSLFFQASQPVNNAFRSILRVYSPSEGVNWAQVDQKGPRSIPVDWWQADQVITERFVMTTTVETPVGAHHLDLSVLESDVKALMLGYVVVPWRGEIEPMPPIEARLSDEIRLVSYTPLGAVSAGAEVDVTLYWEALRRPVDNYVAFIHLIGPDGHLLANHDGEPMNQGYPTRAWGTGEIVPDTHRLSIPLDAPAGTYTLKTGMYRWPSLERLPAWDRNGTEQPDRTILLQSVAIR